jgi:hypothetical protein
VVSKDVLQLTAHGAMALNRLQRATKLLSSADACNEQEKLPRVLYYYMYIPKSHWINSMSRERQIYRDVSEM